MGLTQRLGTIPLAIQTDSSNNVGIGGAANASFKLAVTGAGSLTGNLAVGGTTNDTSGGLYSNIAIDATSYSRYSLLTSGTARGRFQFDGTNTSMLATSTGGKLQLQTLGANAMEFYTNDALRATITSSGSLGIGNTNPYSRLDVRGGGISQTTTDFSAGSVGTIVYMRTGTTTGNTFGLIQVGNTGDNVAGNLVLNQFGGNVGIGTSSPANLLSVVQSNSAASTTLDITNSSNASTTTKTAQLLFRISDTANDNKPAAAIVAYPDGVNNISSGMYFSTRSGDGGPFERMRITSGGAVLIGTTTSNGWPLEIQAAGGGEQIYLKRSAANAQIFMGGSTGAETTLFVRANGSNGVYMSANATSWTSNSDERLKNINGEIANAVDKINTLRAVNFSWKSDETNKEVLGLIAQDVEKVLPQIIDKSKINEEKGDEIEYLGVRYTELIPVLVKAIQELSAKITALENK